MACPKTRYRSDERQTASVQNQKLRLATWNLERASSRAWRRAPAQQERMAEVDADIWVITETHIDRSPGDGFDAVFSPPHLDRRPDDSERWTAIWSRWPLTELPEPAAHRRGTILARVETPVGPLLVYGCVIAYGHEPEHDDQRPARAWEVHAAEVDRQVAEWQAIRAAYPSIPLVVAGDLNQGRSGRRWDYGTKASKQALTDGLASAGLRSLTDVDLVARGSITERSHVEHICISHGLDQFGPVHAWDRVGEDGASLSDHPTLAVDVVLAAGPLRMRRPCFSATDPRELRDPRPR